MLKIFRDTARGRMGGTASELEAACRKCVRLKVNNLSVLCRVLDKMSLDYSVVSDDEADIYASVSVTKLVTSLSELNCEVLSMHENDESLENYYVNLVGAGKGAAENE